MLTAIVQGPNPLGQQVLYIAGKQGNGNGLTDDTVIFRLEFATAFTPYSGPTGRIADTCCTDGVYSGGTGTAPYSYENPFHRMTCLPAGGPCPGQPDGTACDDVGPVPLGRDVLRGECVVGPPVPDGTPCPDSDTCNGLETCLAGVCQPATSTEVLTVKGLKFKLANGALSLTGGIHPASDPDWRRRGGVTLFKRGGPGLTGRCTLDDKKLRCGP